MVSPERKRFNILALLLDTECDGFTDPLHHLIERAPLRVAAAQLRHRCSRAAFPCRIERTAVIQRRSLTGCVAERRSQR